MNGIREARENFKAIYAGDKNFLSPLCSFNTFTSLKDIQTQQSSENINKELDHIQEWLKRPNCWYFIKNITYLLCYINIYMHTYGCMFVFMHMFLCMCMGVYVYTLDE